MSKKHDGPRVLYADIETAPVLGYVWALFDQNVGLNQIRSDWYILSWAAKWGHSDKVLYQDQRHASNIENDAKLLKGIWELLDECDILVTQNGVRFDSKKLNARFIQNGYPPPSPYKHIDTLQIARKKFAFTSNKLEYMSEKLCVKYRKLKHSKFPGFEMWKECLAGNKAAWKEMERYNRHDVLCLEELAGKLMPWDQRINFDLYRESSSYKCNCGSTSFERRGYSYTIAGKYARLRCKQCGAWSADKVNLLALDKRKSLRKVA